MISIGVNFIQIYINQKMHVCFKIKKEKVKIKYY
jgi:hypothetical protein